MSRIFLLSPASCSGRRAEILTRPQASFELAVRMREGRASVGEAFAFLSGLYFRGKLDYARTFAQPPPGVPGVLVITPGDGLVEPGELLPAKRMGRFAAVRVDLGDARYVGPLRRDARALALRLPDGCEVVLLGSIASGKYVEPLGAAFGERLRFPSEFVGRGDMSRGGLLLRCVESGVELAYVPVEGAVRRGKRPERLTPVKGILLRAEGR